MKTIKLLGCAGTACAALLFSTNSVTFTENRMVDNEVHSQQTAMLAQRVSHNLAADVRYTAGVVSGYKWGIKALDPSSRLDISGTSESLGGYKWGRSNAVEQAGSRWGRSNAVEQAGSRWGRN